LAIAVRAMARQVAARRTRMRCSNNSREML
jgi:hypothetical protein